MNNIVTIIDRITERRKELGLSYQALADKTGLSKSTLQRYESGSIKNIPLSKLKTLANGLQTTPEWLMGFHDTTYNNMITLPRAEEFEDVMSYHWAWPIIYAYKNKAQLVQKAVCDVLGIPYVSTDQSIEDRMEFERAIRDYIGPDPDDYMDE